MRSKGYKCYNYHCNGRVGDSPLCGESGYTPLNCINRVISAETNADQKKMDMKSHQKEPDPTPDVLMFIGRFSSDGWRDRQEVIDAFTHGCCFWFAYILAARFGKQYGAEIVTDYVANHFATRIGGRVYDITGDVTDKGTWEPWDECSDSMLRDRITWDCIMF